MSDPSGSPTATVNPAGPQTSDAEQLAGLTDLHFATCEVPLGECTACMVELRSVRRHIAAAAPLIEKVARKDEREKLEAAGRLLPEGCRVEVSVILRWYGAQGRRLDDWGTCDVETARGLAKHTRPSKAVRGEILTRGQWTSDWSVVEQVEVQAPGAPGA